MYVILQWNQAGGTPTVAGGDLYDEAAEAEQATEDLRHQAHPRRDRFTVHEVDDEPLGGWS